MFILVYLCYDYHNYFFQVAAVAAFTQVEEVERILMVPWEWGEKVERDFSRKGWVEEPCTIISWVGSEEVVELMEKKEQEEEEEEDWEEVTLGEAVERMGRIPVGVEENPLMLEKIRKMDVVIKHLAMVRWPLHYCRINRPSAI